MGSLRVVKVFVASSADVMPERQKAREVVDRLNKTSARQAGLHLDLYRWEESAVPGLHAGGPQGLIDPELAQADIVVVVAWNRFGPGTAHEAAESIRRWQVEGSPRVMAYFCDRPTHFTTLEALDDKRKVIEFRQALSLLGLHGSYVDTVEFGDALHDHLAALLPSL